MTWRIDDPQGNEAGKVKYDIVPFTRGRVLDMGCGPFKAFPHFIGVDNGHHAAEFGWKYAADFVVDTCERLEGKRRELDRDTGAETMVAERIADASCDAVFSSHLLEHIEDTEGTLTEWWRVVKPGGYLILYLPHKDFYPNVGAEGANPDHKHDFRPDDIVALMKQVGEWDLVVNEERNGGFEYSFLQVYKKLEPLATPLPEGPRYHYTYGAPRPAKTACVVRYGGIGDMIMMASLLPQLKERGFHVTIMTTPTGQEVVRDDPHIDAFLIQDQDQVPNGDLSDFWRIWEAKFDVFVNLSESVEGTLLALPGRANHRWPDALRQKYMNENYLEFTHELAGLPFKPAPHFYPSDEEAARVRKWREPIADAFVVMWCLAGSSVHKTYPHTDQVMARLMMKHSNIRIVLVGDEACQILEAQWEAEPRVIRLSGKIGVRETLSLACLGVDCVVGPETGVLNAVSHLKVPKVIMLSHSSRGNLTKHWVNTVNLMPKADEAPCFPCHRLHTDRTFCPDHKIPLEEMAAELEAAEPYERDILKQHIRDGKFSTGAALCAWGIHPPRVVEAIMASQPKKRIVVPREYA